MFASERHNFITSSAEGRGAKRPWAILTLFALIAGYLVALIGAPSPARAEFNFSCTSSEGYSYFVNTGSSSLSVLYTGSNTNVANVPLGGAVTPYGVTSLPDGSRLYASTGSNTVKIVDTRTLAVTTLSDPGFNFTTGIWARSDGQEVYVANSSGNTLSVINTATNTVTATISLPGRPVTMNATGDLLYMSNSSGAVIVMNMVTHAVTTLAASASRPSEYLDVNSAFVATANQNSQINLYDRATGAYTRTITYAPAGGGAIHGLGFVPGTNYLVATVMSYTTAGAPTTGHTLVFDATSGALLRDFVTPNKDMRVATASPFHNQMYIAGASTSAGPGVVDVLNTSGAPATWTYTANQTALQTNPDNHEPAMSCMPPLTGTKAFAKSPIALGEVTRLTITITNQNLGPATGLPGTTLTDNLPANIRIATTPNAATTCTSGSVDAPAGGSTLTLSNGTVPAAALQGSTSVPGSCTVSVDVIGVATGADANVIPAANLSAPLVGPSTTSFSAPIEVLAPGLRIAKASDDADGIVEGGQTLTYTLTVTNSGTIAQSGLTVDDVLPAGVTYVPESTVVTQGTTTRDNAPGGANPDLVGGDPVTGTLVGPTDPFTIPPGQTMTVRYQVTVDAPAPATVDSYTNTASVSSAQEPTPIETSNTVEGLSALQLDKQAGTPVDVNGNGSVDAGDTIAYTFTVTNTGNVTVNDLTVSDPKVGAVTCDVTSLAPTEVATCTAAPYEITQAETDAGEVANTATASGVDPGGDPVPSNESSTTTQTDQTTELTFDKTAGTPVDTNGDGLVDAGDTIAYTFTVTNTGNVPVADVTVTDPKLGPVTCDMTSLAPGEVASCTAAPYTITQAEADAGSVENTATAAGTPPGEPAVPSNPDTANTPVDQAPQLLFDKTAGTPVDVNANGLTDAGDTIAYTFTVTNTGNVTVADIVVTDPKVGVVVCDVTTLAPGEVASCSAEPYTITADDETAGQAENTAAGAGSSPGGDRVPSNDDTTDTPVVPSAPALTFEKSAGTPADVNGNGLTDVGDTIVYTFTATNTGNVPLSDVTVDDPKVGAVTCDATTLAVGETATCTSEPYAITQADLDAGAVKNTATATGTPPGGPAVPSNPSTTTTPTDQQPSLALVKTGVLDDGDRDDIADAGEVIHYGFRITNTGNVTMSDIGVDDPLLDEAGEPISCPAAPLPPGESLDCSASHTVTAAEATGKALSNTATATGTPGDGEPIHSDPSTVETPTDIPPAPGPAHLPTTGCSVPLGWSAAALAFLLAGAGLFAIGRRRRRGHTV